MGLWVFVSEDGGFGVFVDESTGLECEREGDVEKRMGTLDKSKSVPGKFYESQREKTRAGEVYPERTVDTLYRSVFPGDSTGADEAGVYRARVGMNVTADEKEHKDKKQR